MDDNAFLQGVEPLEDVEPVAADADADAEGVGGRLAPAAVIEVLDAVIAAAQAYRHAQGAYLSALMTGLRAQRTFVSLGVGQGDVVDDYIRALGVTQALAQVAPVILPALWGPEEDQETVALVDGMIEVADTARERFTGLIGTLIRDAAVLTTHEAGLGTVDAAIHASATKERRAGDALRAAVDVAVRTFIAHPGYLEPFQDAYEAFHQPTQDNWSPVMEAAEVVTSRMNALFLLDSPDVEIVARLNELAETQPEGPATEAGTLPDDEPDPLAAPQVAETVLAEATLDEPTRREMLDALVVYRQDAAVTVEAIDDCMQAVETFEDEAVSAFDVLVASLESLKPAS